jgi:protein involved in polysaccharide export with SLBB domain
METPFMSYLRVLIALVLSASLGACQSGQPASTSAPIAEPPAYFVIGAVQHEGLRPFDGDLTVSEAVMHAAPRETVCDLRRVLVLRLEGESPSVIRIDLEHMGESGDSTFNVLVAGGDVIYVPRKSDV